MKTSPTLLDMAKKPSPKLKSEFTRADFKAIKRAICRHLSMNDLTTHKGVYIRHNRKFEQVDEILGLAYTSGSSCAGLWVCNTELSSPKYPGFHYVGFAAGEDGKYYAILWDKEENEILQPL